MTNPISFLFDWLLGLTRPGADPTDVRAFVANPTQAASQAMGTAVTQAQLTQAASAVVAPGAVYGGGNPVEALQHTVADNNGLTFAPQRVFAPETDFASHNDTARQPQRHRQPAGRRGRSAGRRQLRPGLRLQP